MAEHWLPTSPDSGSLSLAPLLELINAALEDKSDDVILRADDWGASFDIAELRDDATLDFPLVRAANNALGELQSRRVRPRMCIDGRCIGPAFALALVCDIQLSTNARLGASEVRYALPPLLDVTRRALERLPAELALGVAFHGAILNADAWTTATTKRDSGLEHNVIEAFRPRPVASAVPRTVAGAYIDLVAGRDLASDARIELETDLLGIALEDIVSHSHETRLHRLLTRDLFAQASAPKPCRITVAGTGQMASTIAAATAASGIDVTVVGRSTEKAERACVAAAKSLEHMARRGPLFVDAERSAQNLHPATEIPADSTGIIEAVVEDAAVKRSVFERARNAAPDAWLATTSSSIALDELGTGISLLHFAYPAEVSPVVEVAYPASVPAAAANAMRGYLTEIGKVGVEVRSVPGYVVSRLLFAYLLEGSEMCALGAAPDAVDAAARAAGFMLGPLTIIDSAAVDLIERICDNVLEPAYGERFGTPDIVRRLVERGELGRGSGSGFFLYGTGETRVNPAAIGAGAGLDQKSIGTRLTLAVVAEAARLARECVASPAAVDLLAVTCVRFPVDTGGPLALRASADPETAASWAELAGDRGERLEFAGDHK